MTLLTSSEVLKVVNITYRQLSYWQLKGIIKPTLQKLGSRDFKRYTQQDIDTLKTVKQLLDEGYSLPATETLKEIAKRKELEEALRENREKYRTLVELSADAIFIHDYDGRYLYVNQTCTKLFGREPDEIIGKKLTDFFVKRKAKEMLEGIRRVFSENKVVHIEYSVSLGGADHYFFATLSPIHNVQGDVISVMRVARDITERKKTEEEIKNYQKKIEILINSSNDLVFLKDRDFRYLIANKAHEKLFNIKIKDIIGKSDFDFMPKEIAEGCRRSDGEALKSEHPIEREEFVGDRCFDVVKQRVVDANGNIIGIAAVIRDITERKKMEEALRTSEQRFRDLCETTTDWVWEVDKDGVYTYASPKVKELLGYEISEVLGKTPFDLMPQEEAKKISKYFYDKVANKEVLFRLENINIHKDGHQVVLETSGIPILDEKGNLKGYRGIDRDITEYKEAEKVEELFKER